MPHAEVLEPTPYHTVCMREQCWRVDVTSRRFRVGDKLVLLKQIDTENRFGKSFILYEWSTVGSICGIKGGKGRRGEGGEEQ